MRMCCALLWLVQTDYCDADLLNICKFKLVVIYIHGKGFPFIKDNVSVLFEGFFPRHKIMPLQKTLTVKR